MNFSKLAALAALCLTSIIGTTGSAQAGAIDPVCSTHGGFTVHANFQPARPMLCDAAAASLTFGNQLFDTNFLYDGRVFNVASAPLGGSITPVAIIGTEPESFVLV